MSCTFNPDCVDASLNPQFAGWIKPVKNDPSKVLRSFCLKTISLSNMGKQALTSYLDSMKHKKYSTATGIQHFKLQIKQ